MRTIKCSSLGRQSLVVAATLALVGCGTDELDANPGAALDASVESSVEGGAGDSSGSDASDVFEAEAGCLGDECPFVPQNTVFPHIKTYASIYGTADSEQAAWCASHLDMGTAAKKYTNTSLEYVSWSDLAQTRKEYADLYRRFDDKGLDFNDAFLHLQEDFPAKKITGYDNAMEGRFFRVLVGSEDKTQEAFGDKEQGTSSKSYELPLCATTDALLYVGQTWKFDEVDLTVATAASADFKGTWEYWNGSAWKSLVLETDTTLGLAQSGAVTFPWPADWSKAPVGDTNLYSIRLTCPTTGGPVLRSTRERFLQYKWGGISAVSGRRYASASEGGALLPGWNPVNDKNGDGYLDKKERANPVDPKATARSRSEARLPAPYLTNRWLMNLGNPEYAEFQAQTSLDRVKAAGVDGLFVDNCGGSIPSLLSGAQFQDTSADDFRAGVAASVAQLRQFLGNRPMILNGGLSPAGLEFANGAMTESAITWEDTFKETPEFLEKFWADISARCKDNKAIIVTANPNDGIGPDPQPETDRKQLYSLARYYLTASSCTYYDYQDHSNYAHPWEDWYEAIEVDLGTPSADYSLLAAERVGYPDPPPANLLKNPSFELDTNNDGAPDYWTCATASGHTACTLAENAKDGTRCAQATTTAGYDRPGGFFQYVTLKPDTSYTLSAWLKTDSSASDDLAASFYINCGDTNDGGLPCVGTSTKGIRGVKDWTLVATVVKTASNTSGSYVYSGRAVKGTGTVFSDDVRLEEGEFPLAVFSGGGSRIRHDDLGREFWG